MDQPTDPYMPLKPVSTYRKKKAIENVCSLQKPRYYLKRNQFFTRQYVDCDKVASLIESSFSTKRKLSANQLEPSQPEYKKTKTSSTTAEDSVEPNADQAIQLRLFKIVNDIKSTSDGYDEEGRFIGPQFLEQEYFLSLQEDRTNPFQLCRPWSLLDLLGRMATFKLATWRTKPSGLDASNCARYGWINSASDIIKCYACNAQVESPTEAGQLVDRHGGTCPWRTSFCNEKLYSIPQTTFWNLAEETQNQINLLANHLQDKIPKVEHALDVDQINDLLKKMGRGVDSQALVVLQLFGWFPVIKSHAKLPGPTLRCWMCHRQLGCWNFASFSSGISPLDVSNLQKMISHCFVQLPSIAGIAHMLNPMKMVNYGLQNGLKSWHLAIPSKEKYLAIPRGPAFLQIQPSTNLLIGNLKSRLSLASRISLALH
ncbi:hypothetical protein DSO57_1028724 [Entomophthora muscae]|uniref:Uncharacterized protein n=1 Tax=Entomophthora muscae TaxID=34485 RepID=A0ACC2UBA1_9FUNG|nr:hypothetical protein DSO57_1028724 [Entomophthora muscae]